MPCCGRLRRSALQAEPAEAKDELQKKARNPDALIQFRQLKTKRSALDDLDDQAWAACAARLLTRVSLLFFPFIFWWES